MKKRQNILLNETVKDYIQTAEPVGSAQLMNRSGLNCSSATIRNDMKVLVDEGYLMQPHTSSGRVPTEKGYRYFVDQLPEHAAMSASLTNVLNELTAFHSNTAGLLTKLNQLMASMLDYTVITMLPSVFQHALRAVHMVLLDVHRVLIVFLSTSGVENELLCDNLDGFSQDELTRLSSLISERIEGASLPKLDERFLDDIRHAYPKYHDLIDQLTAHLSRVSDSEGRPSDLHISGYSNMMKLPEFNDVNYARQVMTLLEDNHLLLKLLQSRRVSTPLVEVLIGTESGCDAFSDCSLITMPYCVDDVQVGTLGVLGPTRMTYNKLIPMLDHIGNNVNSFLNSKRSV